MPKIVIEENDRKKDNNINKKIKLKLSTNFQKIKEKIFQ